MNYVISTDGAQLAYDVQGSGQALILLHGGFQTRDVWQPHLEALTAHFKVITLDIRGHGQSDMPESTDAYRIQQLVEDVNSVADACAADQFSVVGYSYGGNIARYLQRVRSLVMIGIPFGAAAHGDFRQKILALQAKWESSSAEERHELKRVYYIFGAMLDWPDNHPEDLTCPVLAIVGTENQPTYDLLKMDAAAIGQTGGELWVLDGLNHQQELEHPDLTKIIQFLQV